MSRERSRIGLAALVLCAVLCIAAAASAHPPGPPDGPPGGLVERNAERLGLSGDARAAVQAVVDASGARHAELSAKIDAARNAMRALLSKPIPDANAVMAQADAIGALETELHKNRLRAIMQIRALLSPAQRDELLKILEETRAQRDREGDECERHGETSPEAPH